MLDAHISTNKKNHARDVYVRIVYPTSGINRGYKLPDQVYQDVKTGAESTTENGTISVLSSFNN
jgi:hypothetical protein